MCMMSTLWYWFNVSNVSSRVQSFCVALPTAWFMWTSRLISDEMITLRFVMAMSLFVLAGLLSFYSAVASQYTGWKNPKFAKYQNETSVSIDYVPSCSTSLYFLSLTKKRTKMLMCSFELYLSLQANYVYARAYILHLMFFFYIEHTNVLMDTNIYILKCIIFMFLKT